MIIGRLRFYLLCVALRAADLLDAEGTLSHLIALDERSGRVLAGNPSPYRFPGRPGPGPRPTAMLTTPGNVSVLDAATGTVLRTVVVGGHAMSSTLMMSALVPAMGR